MSEQKAWRPMMKLMIGGDDKFLGPGSAELLTRISATGSVRLASAQMGLSYSKAWVILNNLEREAGFRVVLRKKGGATGGEARLTEPGEQLLERYLAFEQECQCAVDEIFKRYFGSFQ